MSIFTKLFGKRAVDDAKAKEASAVFESVRIGTQVWMLRNLDVVAFRNGDPIPEARTDEEWVTAGAERRPAWCFYDNDPGLGATYGRLYNWFAVTDARGLAPSGWHVPADSEYAKPESRELARLISHVGGSHYAGSKLKEAGTVHWHEPNNSPADNSSGFTALPGGGRAIGGRFTFLRHRGEWWTASRSSEEHAYLMMLQNSSGGAVLQYTKKASGLSVRCLRD